MSTNPSHILIARSSRGAASGAHQHAPSPAAPAETHAAAAGIFRSRTRGSAANSYSHRRASHSASNIQYAVATGESSSSSGLGSGGSGSSGSGGGAGSGWTLEEFDADDGSALGSGDEMNADEVDLDLTFTQTCRFPGTVKIVVESTTFWCHREILVFASPFFEAALSGDWSETRKKESSDGDSDNDEDDLNDRNRRRHSVSSVITISQTNNPHDKASVTRAETPSPISFAAASSVSVTTADLPHTTIPEHDIDVDAIRAPTPGSSSSTPTLAPSSPSSNELGQLDVGSPTAQGSAKDGNSSGSETDLDDLESELASLELATKQAASEIKKAKGKERKPRTRQSSGSTARPSDYKIDAFIVLKEERAIIFHDFLKYVYPHLECQITWNNVGGLMNISSKLCVPALTQHCLSFLLTHAAGKPIKAMRIAEIYDEEQLYREASRFVLDNLTGWSEAELGTLSQQTLLKLEKRKNWFLERVLKLGLTNIAKDYQCCPTCPDSDICARQLDEKWRHAYNACFRFGPCQPSMVYRYLRGLEGVTPPLSLRELACQNAAKAFTIALFDRMFSLGVRGSGTGADPPPVAPRIPGAVVPSSTPAGPKRHFLYCTLKT